MRSQSRDAYDKLFKPLSSLYSKILEYQLLAICHLSKKQLSRAWDKLSGQDDWANKESEMVEASNKCKEYIVPLQRNEIQRQFLLEMEKLDSICQVGANIAETIKDENEKTKEYEFLQELKLTAKDYLGGKEFNPSPVSGTCVWFYKNAHLSEWLQSEESSVFWITAGPGCGKSVLARALIIDDHLDTTTTTINDGTSIGIESTGTMVCYFFFKDDSQQRSSVNSAMCAILHQLLSQNATLLRLSLPAYKRSGKALTESFDDLWNMLLHCAKLYKGDIICVLDALDECHNQDRDRLIGRLDRLYANESSSISLNLKFLITSRPYDDIERAFKTRRQIKYFHFDADERYEDISRDINLVVDVEVASFASEFGESDRAKISSHLKSQGTNTYLWLHLTLGIIRRDPSEYSRPRDIENLLSDIPSEISEAYEKLLAKSKNKTKMILLLQILLAASQPLTLDEANYALTLALAEDTIESHSDLEAQCWQRDFRTVVKNFCGLIINVHDDKLFFIHLTAQEFLTRETQNNSSATSWAGIFSNAAALHSVMSRCCMEYLLLSDFALRRLPPFIGEQGRFKFLPYAGENWPDHFRGQKQINAVASMSQERQLCNVSAPPLRSWSKWYLFKHRAKGIDDFHLPPHIWTDLAVAAFLGLQTVVEDLIKNGANVNESCGGYGSALNAAVAAEHEQLAAFLISSGANANSESTKGKYTALEVAAIIAQNLALVELLLANGASPLAKVNTGGAYKKHRVEAGISKRHLQQNTTILARAALSSEKNIFYALVAKVVDISTPDAILLAASNEVIVASGDMCVALLLNLLEDRELGKALTEDNFTRMISVPSICDRALRLMTNQSQLSFLLCESILEQIAGVHNVNSLLLRLLPENERQNPRITKRLLQIIARQYNPDTFRLFLKYSSEKNSFKYLLFSAITNKEYSHQMLLILLQFAESDILADEELQKRTIMKCMRKGDWILACVSVFLNLPYRSNAVMRCMIQSILFSFRHDKPSGDNQTRIRMQLLKSVLYHANSQGVVDAQLLKKAAGLVPAEAVEMMFKQSSEVPMLEEQLLRAAAGNIFHSMEIIMLLLDKYKFQSTTITERVVFSAALNRAGFFSLLLQRYPERIRLTVDVLGRIDNWDTWKAILELRKEAVRKIASAVLHAIVNPWQKRYWASAALKCFITICPISWLDPSEQLVISALDSSYTARMDLALLINTFGDRIVVTERILAVAASSQYGPDLLEMLKQWKPHDFRITPWIAERVATGGNLTYLEHLAVYSTELEPIPEPLQTLARFRQAVAQSDGTAWNELDGAWSEDQDADLPDALGMTSLHAAFRPLYPSLQVFEFLLDIAGASVHAVDRKGWTPLHYAVCGSDLAIVQRLLVAGADPYKAALDGETPVSIAEENWKLPHRELNRYTLLLVLKDEWFATFWESMFEVANNNENARSGEAGDGSLLQAPNSEE